MRFHNRILSLSAAVLFAGITVSSALAQDPSQNPPQAPPPDSQQQPPPQYPPQGQYPQQQGQYPPQQAQYPPQGQNSPQGYPPQQYPQQQYPQQPQGQYPAQQGQYPQQGYPPPPPMLAPQQLDQLVAPIALYPDGLLAQTLTASTYSNSSEIPDAAAWANAHQYLHGDALAQAIRMDNLNFDPSVMALLPFPRVLDYMARYMGWTQALGNAVLAERDQVMDAVQRMRRQAYDYRYLQSNAYERVYIDQGAVVIDPVSPGLYYVPYYNPLIVFSRPRPGFFIGGAIGFGPGIAIGASFGPWGWGGVGFGWSSHTILIDRSPWVRTWSNRAAYVHTYAAPYHPAAGARVERHEMREREHREERR